MLHLQRSKHVEIQTDLEVHNSRNMQRIRGLDIDI